MYGDNDYRDYLEHARTHKYLMKIGKGAKARYFYTREQIENYQRLRNRKKVMKGLDPDKYHSYSINGKDANVNEYVNAYRKSDNYVTILGDKHEHHMLDTEKYDKAQAAKARKKDARARKKAFRKRNREFQIEAIKDKIPSERKKRVRKERINSIANGGKNRTTAQSNRIGKNGKSVNDGYATYNTGTNDPKKIKVRKVSERTFDKRQQLARKAETRKSEQKRIKKTQARINANTRKANIKKIKSTASSAGKKTKKVAVKTKKKANKAKKRVARYLRRYAASIEK